MPRATRILLIDDSAVDYELLRRAFLRAEEEVELFHCEDDAGAVRALEERDYDLVFLDSRLQTRTGIELLAEMRASGFVGPVVLYTGLRSDFDWDDWEDLGCSVALAKSDVSPESVSQTIRLALDLD